MTSRTKLWALSAGALALSLALAGCGGGGSGTASTSGDPGPRPPMPKVWPVDLTGLRSAVPTAGSYPIPAGETAVAGEVRFTCLADGKDCTVTVAANGVGATSAGGMATAARSQDYIDAATAAAETREDAIAAEAGQATDADLGGSDDQGNAVATYSMTIDRDKDGTTVEITDTDNPANTDPANPQFVQAMDFEDGRTMHVRDNGEGEHEVVFVYTDIAAPEPTAFAMVDGQTLDARDLDDAVNADEEGSATDDWTALMVETANVGNVMSAGFTAGGAGTLSYPADNDQTMMDEAFETGGTYNGALGTYRCDGDSPCSVTYDAMGEIDGVAGDWVFTPDEGETSDVAATEYLHYGFWLKRTTDEDGVRTYNEVETFAGVTGADASSSVASVKGSATYDGGAVGVYVMNHAYDAGTGDLTDATSGHFQADASLTAIFAQTDEDDILPNQLNTITGTIGSFVLQHGEENEWSVKLEGDIAPNDGTASGTAKGGVMGQDGSFSATFYGDVTAVDHDMDDATPDVAPHPSSVVGEFNATFSNGSVAGGFGARTE